MIDIDELLSAADEIFEAREPEFVPVVIAKREAGVRFLPLRGEDWRDLVLQYPPRPNIVQDANLGYNVDAVVAAFPNVALVMGDEVDDLIRGQGEDGKPISKWPAVWARLSGTGRKDIATAIWDAHERAPERLVDAARKASTAKRGRKRS